MTKKRLSEILADGNREIFVAKGKIFKIFQFEIFFKIGGN